MTTQPKLLKTTGYCPISPAHNPAKMSRSSAKKMCAKYQAETHKIKGDEYHSYPFCHKTCKGRNLSKNVEFNDDLIKDYNQKHKGKDMKKVGYGLCGDCGIERTLQSVAGKKICAQCSIVRSMAKNNFDAVLKIVEEIRPGGIKTTTKAAKDESVLSEQCKKQTIRIKELKRNYDIVVVECKKQHDKNEVLESAVSGMEALLIHRTRHVHDLLAEKEALVSEDLQGLLRVTDAMEGIGVDIELKEALETINANKYLIFNLENDIERLETDNLTLKDKADRATRCMNSIMDCNRKTQSKADIAWCIADGVASGRVVGVDPDVLNAIREAV